MKKDKSGRFRPRQIREGIAFIPYDKFFNYLIYMEKNAVGELFNMKNLVYKKIERLYI